VAKGRRSRSPIDADGVIYFPPPSFAHARSKSKRLNLNTLVNLWIRTDDTLDRTWATGLNRASITITETQA